MSRVNTRDAPPVQDPRRSHHHLGIKLAAGLVAIQLLVIAGIAVYLNRLGSQKMRIRTSEAPGVIVADGTERKKKGTTTAPWIIAGLGAFIGTILFLGGVFRVLPHRVERMLAFLDTILVLAFTVYSLVRPDDVEPGAIALFGAPLALWVISIVVARFRSRNGGDGGMSPWSGNAGDPVELSDVIAPHGQKRALKSKEDWVRLGLELNDGEVGMIEEIDREQLAGQLQRLWKSSVGTDMSEAETEQMLVLFRREVVTNPEGDMPMHVMAAARASMALIGKRIGGKISARLGSGGVGRINELVSIADSIFAFAEWDPLGDPESELMETLKKSTKQVLALLLKAQAGTALKSQAGLQDDVHDRVGELRNLLRRLN